MRTANNEQRTTSRRTGERGVYAMCDFRAFQSEAICGAINAHLSGLTGNIRA